MTTIRATCNIRVDPKTHRLIQRLAYEESRTLAGQLRVLANVYQKLISKRRTR